MHHALYRLFFPYLTCCACGKEARCDDRCLCSDCAAELDEWETQLFLRGEHEVWIGAKYDGAAADLVRRLKFRRDREAGRIIGLRCAQVYQQIGRKYDLIAPAPLSKSGMRERGYNQCMIFGREIARQYGVPLAPKALYRVRRMKIQHDLSWRERFENAYHAFSARENLVRGKMVLFLDDVFTSGATSDDCVRALYAAGAARVDVLCFSMAEPHGAQDTAEISYY